MGSRRSSWSLAFILPVLVPALAVLVPGPSPASETRAAAATGKPVQGPRKARHPKSIRATLFKECGELRELALPTDTASLEWIAGARLEILSASGSKITSLAGLPPGLRELDVSNTGVQTLRHVPESLRVLDIRGTPIRDLRELPGQLEVLNISGEHIQDLKSLRASIYELHLEDFPKADFSQLPANLRALHLNGPVFRTLNNLPPSLKRLTLQNTGIESLKGLREALPELTYLALIDNDSLRFEAGDLPANLTELKIDQRQGGPADLSALTYLNWLADRRDAPATKWPPFLCSLTLKVDHLPGLPELPPSLRSLSLVGASFDPRVGLPANLESLSLINYRGPELDALPPSLKRLTLKFAGVSRLPRDLSHLEELQIRQANLENLRGTQGELRKLVLCEMTLQRWDDVKTAFPKLEDIVLCDSGSFRTLGPLPDPLTKLSLSGTKIGKMPGLNGELKELNISKTPLRLPSLASLPRKLETLIVGKGQVVSWEGFPPGLKVLRIE